MSQQVNINLVDGETTPVTRVFTPQGMDSKGVAKWRYIPADGAQAGFQWLTFSNSDPNPSTGATKASWKLWLPTLEVISGSGLAGYTPQPQVAFTEILEIVATLPSRDNNQQRKNVHTLGNSLTGNASFKASIADLERFS